MEEPVNWEARVQEFAEKDATSFTAVTTAKGQAERLEGTPDYWEAVYTLARQAVTMLGARGEG